MTIIIIYKGFDATVHNNTVTTLPPSRPVDVISEKGRLKPTLPSQVWPVRLPVYQSDLDNRCVWGLYEMEGVRALWIFIMTSPVYWLWYGGHTQVRLSGLHELAREEGGSKLIAHIRDIKESAGSRQLDRWRCLKPHSLHLIYTHIDSPWATTNRSAPHPSPHTHICTTLFMILRWNLSQTMRNKHHKCVFRPPSHTRTINSAFLFQIKQKK